VAARAPQLSEDSRCEQVAHNLLSRATMHRRSSWSGRWGGFTGVSRVALVALTGTAGCGDDAAETSGSGGSSSVETSPVGSGVAGSSSSSGGGGAYGCPENSSRDESGACVGSLGSFETASMMVERRDHHVTFVVDSPAGRFLYVEGGAYDMEDLVDTTERALIGEDGSLGPFEIVATGFNRSGHGVAVRPERVLFFGGRDRFGSSAQSFLLDVLPDGMLGEPVEVEALGREAFHVGGAQVGDFVYSVGGIETRDGDPWSSPTVEFARFDAEGLSAWQETTPLPVPRSHHVVTAHGGFLYVAGGLNREGTLHEDTSLADVTRASIAEDGSLGEWEQLGDLPMDLAVAAATTVGDSLWIVGGLVDGTHDHQGPTGQLTTFTAAVHRAVVTEGQLGPFEIVGQLPRARGHCHQVPIALGVMYSAGGIGDDGLSQGEVFRARFD